MSVFMKKNWNAELPEFAALVGLDWGDARHAVALRDVSSGAVERQTVVHAPEPLHAWVQQLEARYGGRPVAVAVETSRGPLIQCLSAVPWLVIYPVHPATSARFRKAFAPSGAKDDAPDALVLLDLLWHHRAKLRPLELEDVETRLLGRLCELRRKSVDRRTALTNEMRAVLKEYFPHALQLVGEVLHTPLALDFLQRWPDLLSLKTAKESTVKRFYYAHNVRRPEAVAERLALIAGPQALTVDHAVVSVGIRHLERLREEVRLVQKHILADEKEIAAVFKNHPEAYLFRELPGAGAVSAPRLLVGFGTDRSRYSSAAEFLRYSGVAPVKKKRRAHLDPLAVERASLPAAKFNRVGGPKHALLLLGQGVLPATESARQTPLGHPAGARVQMGSHSLEMLTRPPALL